VDRKTSTASGLPIAALIVAAISIFGCGSSSTSILQPSNDRCQIAIGGSSSTIPADGGTGSIAVNAARECLWSATSESPWLTITSGASGQGDGTVTVQAVSNPAPAMRRASVVINNSRAEISQAAAPCQFRLASPAQSFPAAGGEGSVGVETLEGCNWTATSGSGWVAITGLQNPGGPGSVRFRVEQNSGDPRTGALTIAGLSFSVVQSGDNVQCSYSIEPTGQSTPAAGGSGTIAVTAPGNCPWTALSQVPWITVNNGANGTGNGVVNITVAANSGATRTGAVIVASQVYTVTQAGVPPPCSFTIAPTSQSIPVGGGNATVNVTTAAGCGWTAVSQAAWIAVTSGASGSGNGAVGLTIAANTGAARTGTVAIAGQTYTVTQPEAPRPCSFAVAPTDIASPAAGGTATVTVATEAACSWTAVRQTTWITVTSGASGSGNGTVTLTIAGNDGPARTGSVVIAGQTVTITQSGPPPPPCTYSINPGEAAIGAGGGTTTVAVTTQNACTWTAVSNASWITTNNPTGNGSGTVEVTVAANTGPPSRNGTVTIAGHTFTVTQAGSPPACVYELVPTTQAVSNAGGEFTVQISTQPACGWTATPDATWIEIVGSPSGTGAATLTYRVQPNPGAPRTANINIGPQRLTVVQGPM
jgi:Viral BACON domain/Putative binding domain, N-terminal